MNSEVLNGLDADQKQAASVIDRPVCTMAGPGSGKTRALTHSIAFRIEQGAEPSSVAAITFTNKAKKEIKGRLETLLGKREAKAVFVGTYHGYLSINVLMPNRKHDLMKVLGYENGFVIAEEDDADKILDETFKSLPDHVQALIDVSEFKPRDVKDYMSKKRADGLFASDAVNLFSAENKPAITAYKQIESNLKAIAQNPNADDDINEVEKCIESNPKVLDLLCLTVWRQYEKRMARMNAIDYDGMMVVARYLLMNDPRIATELAKELKHILLDEFQDTNNSQWDCMRLIIDKMEKKNVFVVGDPDQCIYQFRSANPNIMRDFASYFPDAQMCYLTTNYRSTSENVALCNNIKIFINENNANHPMKATRCGGHLPIYKYFADENDEVDFVLRSIAKLLKSGVKPDKIAVLYRGKNQKKALEGALASTQIKYTVIGDTSFYDTKEVRDTIAALRMISNEMDIMGFARAIGSSIIPVDGITLRNAIEAAREKGQTLTPMKYLYDRFTPKGKVSNTESSMVKMNFWKELNSLHKLSKFLSEEDYIYSWILDGYRQESNDPDFDPTKLGITKEYALQEYKKGVENNIVNPLFFSDMAEYRLKVHKGVEERLRKFFDTYFLPKIIKYSETSDKNNPEKIVERKANIDRVFANVVHRLQENMDFEAVINELVLLTEQKIEDLSDCVQLMTIHASKGLEFDTVFMIGTEQRSYFSHSTVDDDLESEACAFFVAASRAERLNIMTGAHSRTINGNYDKDGEELVFIRHMNKDLINDLTEPSVRDLLAYTTNAAYKSFTSRPAQKPAFDRQTANTTSVAINPSDLGSLIAQSRRF